ncbi:XRE family transcriptional regulator [Bacillus sp. C1-1]|nr:XRE family transcriptional regulator [Bacillus sp. C1-1]
MKSRIGDRIDERGLKNKFVAMKLGVTQVQVSKWRTGNSYPRVDKLFKLAALLGVKVDDLYEMDDSSGNNEYEE